MSIDDNGQVQEETSVSEGANGDSPTPQGQQVGQSSAGGAAKPASESVPFHKNPEFQSYLERQRKGWEREYSQRTKSDMDKLRSEYDQKISQISQRQGNQGLSKEQSAEVENAAELIMSTPGAMKRLGLDRVEALEKKLAEYETGRTQDTYHNELSSVVDKYAGEFGFEKAELRDELDYFIQNDPLWSQFPKTKGIAAKAARDYFSDKQQELADRAANLKLVTEQKSKGALKTGKPIGGKQEATAPKNMKELMARYRQESPEL